MMNLEQVAAKVRSVRKSLGLSHEKLAFLLSAQGYSTTSGTIRYLEAAKGASVDFFLLSAIAQAANRTLWELLEEETIERKQGENPQLDRFERILTKMSPEEVEPHLEALEALAEKRAAALAKRGTKKAAG